MTPRRAPDRIRARNSACIRARRSTRNSTRKSTRSPIRARIRASVIARSFALVAMALQFVFFADHIGASAVAGMGAADPGSRMGVLELCTGDGIVLLAPGGVSDARPDGCAICTNAAILGFAEPFAWTPPVFDAAVAARLPVVRALGSVTIARFPGSRPIRAPPAVPVRPA